MTYRKQHRERITGSWGVYDALKLIRKNGWFGIERPLKDVEFYKIIRSMNLLIAEQIALGETFKIPHQMGVLELRKRPCGVTMKNGHLHITYPVDWKATEELWRQDAEAKQKGLVIRREIPYMYRVYWNIAAACFKNKYFYQFKLNTFIKRALSQNIMSGKTDTLWEG